MLKPTKASIPFVARRIMGSALVPLSNSTHTFHLAGSYFFGVARPDSDVDFYVEYTPDVVAFLKANSFRKLGSTDPDYPEIVAIPERDVAEQNNTFAVFEHITLPIHIQVFYDLNLALATRDILAKAFCAEHTRTRGPHRSKMWKAAEAAAREILSLASPAA